VLASILSLAGYLVPFVLALSVLVFFHELGHYLVARYNGVKVEVFSIGFGHEVFGWNDRVGTRWKISWLPLGGYVKMWGDDNAASTPDTDALAKMSEEDRSQSLHGKTVWQRMAVSAAGPFANYLLAFVLFFGIFAIDGYRYPAPILGVIMENSAAEEGGLKPNDLIQRLDSEDIKQFSDIVNYVRPRPGQAIQVSLIREGAPLMLTVTPKSSSPLLETKNAIGVLGVQDSGAIISEPKNPFQAVGLAAQEIVSISWNTLVSVYEMLSGKRSADGMGGPLMIAKLSGTVSQLGLTAFLWFIALLSINLGLINLFPVPLLDGGHLFLYGIEAIRGKPLSEKTLEWCYRFGLACVASLIILTTWNDIQRLKIIQWFVQLWA
jgi:regulator of sigma E protease